MCGIYGVVKLDQAVDRGWLERRRDLLAHRGPDDAGTWISDCGRVGLAHRRLAVIDLTPAGHQPMLSADGRLAIVFNGEIYNFRELRSELAQLGCAFHSDSDTEVILAAYAMWGEQCLNRFNGMFSFAIYDRGAGSEPATLFLARDRAGKKPLYYTVGADGFEFGSELKAIATRKGISARAINFYLALGYIPGDLSLCDNVQKLPAGHAARLDISTLRLSTWRYWELPRLRADANAESTNLVDEAQKLLLDSVRLRLIADVPLGVLLSGGLDSSLVVAAAARASPKAVQTFTIALPGSALDESRHAQAVAAHFGTEHHRLDLDQPSLRIIDEFAPFVDEPLADSSLLPTFVVSRLTRQHVTVALGGDGGDEIFGGYNDYPAALADQARLGMLPTALLRLTASIAARLPAGVPGRNRVASLRDGPLKQMIWGSPYFDVELRQRILSSDYAASLGHDLDAPEKWLSDLYAAGTTPVDRMTRTHFGSILPDDFLVKVDRASMAHALEVRSPFLDYRLVEFCFSSVPDQWKVRGSDTRRLQKRLAKIMLPHSLDFNRKQGFSIPLDDWLRAEPAAQLHERLRALPDFIERGEVDSLIRGLHAGRANGARLFALIMLAVAAGNLSAALA
jgi:asparagine synthase (glutamine-hydrolysing)